MRRVPCVPGRHGAGDVRVGAVGRGDGHARLAVLESLFLRAVGTLLGHQWSFVDAEQQQRRTNGEGQPVIGVEAPSKIERIL